MHISSAEFIKSAVGTDPIFEDGTPQVAFIGRSNVGKSSVINSLVNQKDLAKTSSFPGRTQHLNLFLINRAFYLVDLPGYGYAKLPFEQRDHIRKLVLWYFFNSGYKQRRVVLIIDAKVGPTKDDLEMLHAFEQAGKQLVVVANKVDALKPSERIRRLRDVQTAIGNHSVIPYSAKDKTGVGQLWEAISR